MRRPEGRPGRASTTSDVHGLLRDGETACLGTHTDGEPSVDPQRRCAFNPWRPGATANHGPIVAILGDGARPTTGADFRGYIALDIRNFATTTSQLYYNGVTSTTASTLKDLEARWLIAGGYPGPIFPPVISPPDPNDQVAVLAATRPAWRSMPSNTRFVPGDKILVAVYPGIIQIPDFSSGAPDPISLPTSGTVPIAGSFKVGRNQSFSGRST